MEKWKNIIEEYKNSECTVQEIIKKYNICLKTFYHHKKQFNGGFLKDKIKKNSEKINQKSEIKMVTISSGKKSNKLNRELDEVMGPVLQNKNNKTLEPLPTEQNRDSTNYNDNLNSIDTSLVNNNVGIIKKKD